MLKDLLVMYGVCWSSWIFGGRGCWEGSPEPCFGREHGSGQVCSLAGARQTDDYFRSTTYVSWRTSNFIHYHFHMLLLMHLTRWMQIANRLKLSRIFIILTKMYNDDKQSSDMKLFSRFVSVVCDFITGYNKKYIFSHWLVTCLSYSWGVKSPFLLNWW